MIKESLFYIKRKLRDFLMRKAKKINITIELEKEKRHTRKNIQNKVTKYKLSITAN